MVNTGIIVGLRPYESEFNGKTYKGYNLCIERSKELAPKNFKGSCIDCFSVGMRALPESYKPQVGDGVYYVLYRENGKQKCDAVWVDGSLVPPELNG